MKVWEEVLEERTRLLVLSKLTNNCFYLIALPQLCRSGTPHLHLHHPPPSGLFLLMSEPPVVLGVDFSLCWAVVQFTFVVFILSWGALPLDNCTGLSLHIWVSGSEIFSSEVITAVSQNCWHSFLEASSPEAQGLPAQKP